MVPTAAGQLILDYCTHLVELFNGNGPNTFWSPELRYKKSPPLYYRTFKGTLVTIPLIKIL